MHQRETMLTALAVVLKSRPCGWTLHSGQKLSGSSLSSFPDRGPARLSIPAREQPFTYSRVAPFLHIHSTEMRWCSTNARQYQENLPEV